MARSLIPEGGLLTKDTGPAHLAGPVGFMRNHLGGPVHFNGDMPLLSATFRDQIPNPDYVSSDQEVEDANPADKAKSPKTVMPKELDSVSTMPVLPTTSHVRLTSITVTTPRDQAVQTKDSDEVVGETLVQVLIAANQNQRMMIEGT